MQAEEAKRVVLLGLDFGSTTSSALVASAKVARSSATGHMQLNDVQVLYQSEAVFTPFTYQSSSQNIDTEKVAKLIANWLTESGIKVAEIFSGGSMITGLAAQADNATTLSKIITNLVGDSVIATADDPCLESWLAFMGSCSALSRFKTDAPLINFDIGGGTTNVALGLNGDVTATGCYFIGARHFQFKAGSYQITAMSGYGEALLNDLDINKKVGDSLNTDEVTQVMALYVAALEAIAVGDTDFFKQNMAKQHCQVAITISKNYKSKITFSGGVGELLYKISAGKVLPTTTFYGDFGIDLAKAIARSSLLCADLKGCVPEHKGRATVVGLTLHSTEISGGTIYLPKPDCLPMHNLPIIAKLPANAKAAQWQSALDLAASRKLGACIQVNTCSNTLLALRELACQIKHALQASIYKPSQPVVILVDANIGKALGNYISDWGQLAYNLIVIDEVALRNAHFVHIGRAYQGMIPVSFYGLN
jgi:ethanolamine utilization protein EutA